MRCFGLAALGLLMSSLMWAEVLQLQCYVSLAPQAYLVEAVGGNHVAVKTLVQPGDSEEFYQLTFQQRQDLAATKLYFSIGLPFESTLIERLKSERAEGLKIVDCRQGISLLNLSKCACCSFDGKDPHIWLDPVCMKAVTQTITHALIQADPEHAADYQARSIQVLHQLTALDQELATILAPLKGKSILVFHPSFGYLAHRYGFKQIAIEQDGKEPQGQAIKQIINQAQADDIHTLFVQPNFSQRSAQTIAQSLGARIIEVDPLPVGNYIEAMRTLAHALAQADSPAHVDKP